MSHSTNRPVSRLHPACHRHRDLFALPNEILLAILSIPSLAPTDLLRLSATCRFGYTFVILHNSSHGLLNLAILRNQRALRARHHQKHNRKACRSRNCICLYATPLEWAASAGFISILRLFRDWVFVPSLVAAPGSQSPFHFANPITECLPSGFRPSIALVDPTHSPLALETSPCSHNELVEFNRSTWRKSLFAACRHDQLDAARFIFETPFFFYSIQDDSSDRQRLFFRCARYALASLNHQLLEYLAQQARSPSFLFWNRNELLRIACYNKSIEAASILLRHGADPHDMNGAPFTISLDCYPLLKLLLDSRTDRLDHDYNMMEAAVRANLVSVVDLLLCYFVYSSAAIAHLVTVALKNGYDHLALSLAERLGSSVSEGTELNWWQLCYQRGSAQFASLLIRLGLVDPAHDHPKPLLHACDRGHAGIVQLLLVHGADVAAHDHLALRSSSLNGHGEVVALLLQHGADPHVYDNLPLRLACENGHFKAAKHLVARGADVAVHNHVCLISAAQAGHAAVVGLLLSCGSNVHANNDEALRKATENGHQEVVRVLLNYGADIRAIQA
ncbi:ankyrin repeat-containing domain protein [Polychytrium aggregatum]|uniref:ankyrin repeat-containing domain protein n=1 Tax=Polychytrium aggregatum TaxID=110093 RepID=UPI0022FE9CA9|nr:ankyrin repeat-containing domain protein [Polychytrium aggregatum]KAI9199529.1 ankyrin repeat-containing domain protein [Polychytrium aggregatum]